MLVVAIFLFVIVMTALIAMYCIFLEMNGKSKKAIQIFTTLVICYITFFFSFIFYHSSNAKVKNVQKHAPVVYSYESPDQQEAFWLIVAMAADHGFSAETALRIAECESQFQYDVVNADPNSTATGLFQWTQTTWNYIGNPGDRFNPQDNIEAFFNYYPLHPEWWVCK